MSYIYVFLYIYWTSLTNRVIQVHVRIDDSGIVSLDKVELNVEQPPPPKTAEGELNVTEKWIYILK